MPKVRTQQVEYGEKQGIKLAFKFDINVNVDGDFTCYLPDNISQTLTDAGIQLKSNGRSNGKSGFFISSTIDGLLQQVREQCSKYVSKEEVSRTVKIRYSIETASAYQINNDGTIIPNGTMKEGDDSFIWKNGTVQIDVNQRIPFGVRIYVRPMYKIIYQFGNGEQKTEWEEINCWSNVDKKKYPNLHWLSNVTGIGPTALVHEVDYTEQRALFFVNFIKSICILNENLMKFKEPNDLMLLVDSGKQFLLS